MSSKSVPEPMVMELALPTLNGREVTLDTFHSKLNEWQLVLASALNRYRVNFVNFVVVFTFLSMLSIFTRDPKTHEEPSKTTITKRKGNA